MKRFYLFSIFLIIVSVALAQSVPTLSIKGKAVEGFTGEALTGAGATLRDFETKDSLQTATSSSFHTGYDMEHMKLVYQLSFSVPKRIGKYLIEAYAEGYDTVYQVLEINKYGDRELSRNIPDFVFYKKPKQLDEVSVTATKVKFYSRGDTLVYNADAFKLAEGSMLDALIKQLPGVELKDNGEIYVNGKYVESLLLNGKYFFQGDKSIMLNNLGAYTVKNIEVYEKRGELGRLAGRNMGDEEYVMDVKLKKEYLNGFMGNVEVGVGTANRYLGRLFSMWFTSRSRVALVGNINNLNDDRTPGESDSWQKTQIPGDLRTKIVGLDYNWASVDGNTWNFFGNTSLTHTRKYDISSRYATNFLTSGDTYETTFGKTLSHDLNLKTKNDFRWSLTNATLQLSQNFQYLDNDIEDSTLSGVFQEETKNLTEQLLNKIYSGETSGFKDIVINTSLSQLLNKGSMINGGGKIGSLIKIPYTPDIITLTAEGNYKENRYRSFNRYGINYNQEGSFSDVYQFIDNHPDKNWEMKGSTSYSISHAGGKATFGLDYRHSDTTKDSYLYELDRLEDAGVFGVLPSTYLSAYNPEQSYLSHETWNRFAVDLYFSSNFNKKFLYNLHPLLNYDIRNLQFTQGLQTMQARKNGFELEFTNTWIQYQFKPYSTLQLKLERQAVMAPLDRMVDWTDTRDPLNIYIGNSTLKNEVRNNIELRWDFNSFGQKKMKHRRYTVLYLIYDFTQNALTNGYSFNRETGVRTYKMFNVGGNYYFKIFDSFYQAFGPKNQFDVRAFTTATFTKSSDMTGEDGRNFRKSSVKTWSLNENATLSWRIGKQQLSLNGSLTWRNTKGDNAGFNDFTAINAQYGISGQFTLPWNFGISTDLNLYTRSGYSEPYLNTTDVVWNARLTYNVKGGHWLLMLDGFDLLHQLTNVTYNVNALGRVETYTNVMPRYVLFHVQYRFSLQPKKKSTSATEY